jgi:hypothetical protein
MRRELRELDERRPPDAREEVVARSGAHACVDEQNRS